MILEIRFRGEHFGVNGPVGRCLGGTGLERKTPAVTVRGEKPKGRSEITGRMIRGVGGGATVREANFQGEIILGGK